MLTKRAKIFNSLSSFKGYILLSLIKRFINPYFSIMISFFCVIWTAGASLSKALISGPGILIRVGSEIRPDTGYWNYPVRSDIQPYPNEIIRPDVRQLNLLYQITLNLSRSDIKSTQMLLRTVRGGLRVSQRHKNGINCKMKKCWVFGH